MTRSTTGPLGLLDRLSYASSSTSPAPNNVVNKPNSSGSKRPIIIYPTESNEGRLTENTGAKRPVRPTERIPELVRFKRRGREHQDKSKMTPESIVVPIVSCIFGFPLLALTVICCLRRRAKLARERARRRNCELDRGELSVVRLSPMKANPRAISLVRPPRAPPTLELDTVLEERSDPEQTTTSQVEITPDREVGAILFGAVGAAGTAVVAAGYRDS